MKSLRLMARMCRVWLTQLLPSFDLLLCAASISSLRIHSLFKVTWPLRMPHLFHSHTGISGIAPDDFEPPTFGRVAAVLVSMYSVRLWMLIAAAAGVLDDHLQVAGCVRGPELGEGHGRVLERGALDAARVADIARHMDQEGLDGGVVRHGSAGPRR